VHEVDDVALDGGPPIAALCPNCGCSTTSRACSCGADMREARALWREVGYDSSSGEFLSSLVSVWPQPSATPDDFDGKNADSLVRSDEMSPHAPTIVRILSNSSLGSLEHRASMALMLGASASDLAESANDLCLSGVDSAGDLSDLLSVGPTSLTARVGDVPAQKREAAAQAGDMLTNVVESACTDTAFPSVPTNGGDATQAPPTSDAVTLRNPPYNAAFLGSWQQAGVEAEKLEAILKQQGYSWPIRKVALSTKMNMSFEIDDDGDMVYRSQVPIHGSLRIKCVDGAGIKLTLMGTHMVYRVRWVAGGILEMLQENTSGTKRTTSTIRQRYDAQRDCIVSENDSIEGFYTRTFKRC